MTPTVTRSQPNRASLGCGGTVASELYIPFYCFLLIVIILVSSIIDVNVAHYPAFFLLSGSYKSKRLFVFGRVGHV